MGEVTRCRHVAARDARAVIAGVIQSRATDVYTRPGARQMVLDYLGALAQDPPANT